MIKQQQLREAILNDTVLKDMYQYINHIYSVSFPTIIYEIGSNTITYKYSEVVESLVGNVKHVIKHRENQIIGYYER